MHTRKNKTRKSRVRGWTKQQPGLHQRSIMMKKCGKKCFLGPNKTFPICSKNTCKMNKRGIYAAYMRAKEYVSIRGTQKYKRIANKAHRMLYR